MKPFPVGDQRLTQQEFWRLPRHLGWRYEYIDGVAYIEPGACCVVAALNLGPGYRAAGRAPRRSQSEELWPLCLAAFGPTVEYAGYNPMQAENAAREAIATYFDGERGEPRPESVVLEEGGRLVAAALLVETVTGPHLDLLFVAPDQHRRGLAEVAVGACCHQLIAAGERHLTSAYQLANLPSAAWHHKFGFREYPDRLTEQMRRYFLIAELERLKRLGTLTCQQEVRLRFARRRCSRLLTHLDAMLAQERYDEAYTVAHVLTPAKRGQPRRPLPSMPDEIARP
ncbi:MAG: GNAT family N-acetyltransferase [Candidatus Eremiobacteraeota bacterium]|nr:GNAT family N-acetyltransferase [Candidatus Eremiobacteraeota bacterium]